MHRFFCSLFIGLSILGCAHAGNFPAILLGDATVSADGQIALVVTDPFAQIQISSQWIITAERGAALHIHPLDTDSVIIKVDRGNALALDMISDDVVNLPIGTYFVTPQNGLLLPELDTDTPIITNSIRYSLADLILVNQQRYLDSLRIDVRNINHGLSSIIRALGNRR